MDDSDTSSLSSALPSDDERLAPIFLKARGAKSTIKNGSSPATTVSPPKPKRDPSPPHEEVLADNSDIAFIVMFRSRFSSAFPPKLPHFGPQDIERGVVDSVPSPQIENLLCALLGLVLNRKKPVERGHHGRALEEAISTQRPQWPKSWEGVNPLRGSTTFNSLGPVERLNLLRTLIIWSLSSSDDISTIIKDSYKQTRHEDDLNQPLSVQSWGTDGDKRRYWLIEGQDDTNFRLYREGNRALKNISWWSVAGTIEEIKGKAIHIEKDGTQASRRLATRINSAVPRFEATEEKRKRREYRQFRRSQFVRPEPGFSMYEGRTRGKRMRYTYDDEGDESDELSNRRSTRTSDRSTPVDARGPTVTASGRQVRARGGGMYGESLLSGQVTNADTPASNDFEASDDTDEPNSGVGRSRRSGGDRLAQLNGSRKRKHVDGYDQADRMSDEDDASSSENEWNGGDDDDEVDDDDIPDEEQDDESEINGDEEGSLADPATLIVKLKIGQHAQLNGSSGTKNQEPLLEQQVPAVNRSTSSPTRTKEEAMPDLEADLPRPSDSSSTKEEHITHPSLDPSIPSLSTATALSSSDPLQGPDTLHPQSEQPDTDALQHAPPAQVQHTNGFS